MTNDQTKPNADSLDGGESIQTTLGELWELLDKGRHKAWPDCVTINTNPRPWATDDFWCEYTWGCLDKVLIDPKDAYAIARDHIEGWLVEMGFEIGIEPGSRNYYWYDGSIGEWICTFASESLTDAVRYALGQ